jgi:hypothetical protein
MNLRRSLCSIAAVSAGLMAVSGSAQAAPPAPTLVIDVDLPSQDASTPAGDGFCEDFAVHVDAVLFQELRGGGKVTGRGTATLTNNETGKSLTFNVSGPSVTTTTAGVSTVVATGSNVFFTTAANSFPGVPPLIATTGRVRFTVDASGLTTSFQSNGRVTDVCAALS